MHITFTPSHSTQVNPKPWTILQRSKLKKINHHQYLAKLTTLHQFQHHLESQLLHQFLQMNPMLVILEDEGEKILQSISTDEELVKLMDQLSTTVDSFRIIQIIECGINLSFKKSCQSFSVAYLSLHLCLLAL